MGLSMSIMILYQRNGNCNLIPWKWEGEKPITNVFTVIADEALNANPKGSSTALFVSESNDIKIWWNEIYPISPVLSQARL